MARLATFEWHTPPPTSVDETLALYDDGSAVFVVHRPRVASATVGSYQAHPGTEDAQLLAAAGPGPVTFDLLAPVPEAGSELQAAADRVSADSLATPRAVVTFHAHTAGPVDGGRLDVTLLAVAAGTQPVEFELDPTGSSVHFADQDGQAMSWQDLPSLPTGFFTLDAEGLGGVLRPAVVPPGSTVRSPSRRAHRRARSPFPSSWPAGSPAHSPTLSIAIASRFAPLRHRSLGSTSHPRRAVALGFGGPPAP